MDVVLEANVASKPKFSASASSSCNAGLVLKKVVLVASWSVIEIASFTLRSSLMTLLWLACDCQTGRDYFLGIDKFYVGVTWAFIYGVLYNMRHLWRRPRSNCSLASLISLVTSRRVWGVFSCVLHQWVSEQCFTSPPTQYRLYGRRCVLHQQWVKW